MARTVSRVRDNDSVRIAGSLDMHHASGANQKDEVDRMSVANCVEMDMMLLLRFYLFSSLPFGKETWNADRVACFQF